ncbi:hypothetical protein AGMMS49545_09950 [Betaproteobacteria bacterium]|nr:hypothetical protein AGMMS49545_09950 [Betaproteobacteria bacterium]GHU45687.1 hypothetical protein AGMMS50289_17380 [Betaproteobacteria bacterium]
MTKFLHERRDFPQLLALVADERGIDPMLVEKDYWIMHCLWGLQQQGFQFELKGGTSLSKGFGIIHRFSEDIDIRIEPPAGLALKVGRNHDKPAHIESRRSYYADLASRIRIAGIAGVERDAAFDDDKMRSAGIRLNYLSHVSSVAGIKDGVLLELGFDDTAPNRPCDLSSWAWEAAHVRSLAITDNRATGVPCYAPTHTFVEKLQTISTKHRRFTETQVFPVNFLRHYYDVYCLLGLAEIQAFMMLPDYDQRKALRFRTGDERVIAKNPAFLLEDSAQRRLLASEYRKTAALYHQGQPDFNTVLARIHQYIAMM